MAKVIIGIHGLGNKPAGEILQSWWKQAMEEGLLRIGKPRSLPHFELVYWADILYDRPLDESIADSDDPYYLQEKYTAGTGNIEAEDNSLRQKMLDFIEDQLDKLILNDDLTINYSGISDAIIGRYFKDLDAYYADEAHDNKSQPVSTRKIIRTRLSETLKKYEGDEIILIAHSMGSIIAYDVLTFLVPEIEIHSFVTIGSPLGFPVMQGKIAAEWNKKRLVPPRLKTPPGIKKHWYNFADLKDRIALIYKLQNNYEGNWRGIKPQDIVVQNDYMGETEANPHKSFGYLRAAEFSSILLRLMKDRKSGFLRRLNSKFKQAFSSNN